MPFSGNGCGKFSLLIRVRPTDKTEVNNMSNKFMCFIHINNILNLTVEQKFYWSEISPYLIQVEIYFEQLRLFNGWVPHMEFHLNPSHIS